MPNEVTSFPHRNKNSADTQARSEDFSWIKKRQNDQKTNPYASHSSFFEMRTFTCPATKPANEIIHDSRVYEQTIQHEMLKEKPLGNDLLSQEVALQVPSALTDLTAGFGMLPGVTPSLQSPRD